MRSRILILIATSAFIAAPRRTSAGAPAASRRDTHAGVQAATVAIASETRRDFGLPVLTAVRVAFSRSDGAWRGYPDPRSRHATSEGPRTDLPLPATVRWDACFDGRRVGKVRTVLAPNLGAIALANVHQPAAGEQVPFQGKATPAFGGWLGEPVRRPLVLTFPGSCGDPERWKPTPVPRPVLASVLLAFREAVKGVHGCDADGASTGLFDFAASDVVVGKSYASGLGDRIVTLTLRQRPEVIGGCDDGPRDDPWLPRTFAVLANGTVRHLGSAMTLVDAGDYDGDGRSELVSPSRSTTTTATACSGTGSSGPCPTAGPTTRPIAPGSRATEPSGRSAHRAASGAGAAMLAACSHDPS